MDETVSSVTGGKLIRVNVFCRTNYKGGTFWVGKKETVAGLKHAIASRQDEMVGTTTFQPMPNTCAMPIRLASGGGVLSLTSGHSSNCIVGTDRTLGSSAHLGALATFTGAAGLPYQCYHDKYMASAFTPVWLTRTRDREFETDEM